MFQVLTGYIKIRKDGSIWVGYIKLSSDGFGLGRKKSKLRKDGAGLGQIYQVE